MTTTTTTATRAQLVFQAPLPQGTQAHVHINSTHIDGRPESNFEEEKHSVDVHDIRCLEKGQYGVDVSGFDFFHAPSSFPSAGFHDDDAVKREYYGEIDSLVKSRLGAREVFIFDHTIRRRNPGVADDDPSRRQPVSRVHIDQTPSAAVARVRRHLGSRADTLLKGRWQLVNVWRPIEHVAEDTPLALGDYRSIERERDLVPVKLIYPDPLPAGETYNVLHHPDHRYYYVRNQTPDEVTFIKCFDSDNSVAGLTPHTAFTDPQTRPDAPLRQSIEVRCLVFY
ncbi:low-affinity methionine permease [Savitreella phatthalungensis]